MDEAQLRAETEARIRAEYEEKYRREEETRRLNDALNAQRVSASGEPRPGMQANRPVVGDNARVYGAVLAAQMIAGLPGERLADDGFGDGVGVHPDAA